MRSWWVAVALVACGSSSKSTSQPSDPNETNGKLAGDPTNESRDACGRGVTIDCIMYAKHYLSKDPVKAKKILVDACSTAKLGVDGNRPESACRDLFDEKLITEGTEAAELCRKTSFACDAVMLSKLLSEDQIWQLCTETLPACNLAMDQVTTDPEHKAEVEFLSTLFTIRRQVTDAANDKSGNAANPAKGAKAKLPNLGQPECDAIAIAVHNAPRCAKSASVLPGIQVNVYFLSMPWKDISPARKTVLAPHCAEVGKDLPRLLAELCK